jgi:hypothetical protein
VYGVDISTIVFNINQLAITAAGIVPGTLTRVQQLLNEEPYAKAVGPFKVGDDNVRATKTRSMAYSPCNLLELILGADLTDRQLFELIVPALIDDGL